MKVFVVVLGDLGVEKIVDLWLENSRSSEISMGV